MRSFRFKLMMVSIICILLPACITLATYNYLTQDAVKEQAITNSQESMLLVNNYVTNSLKYMLNIANSIQMDSDLNFIFKSNVSGHRYTEPTAEYDEFYDKNKIMKQIDNITIGGEICYVTILLTNGSYYSNYSIYEYNPLNLTKEPWFSQLKNLYGFQSYWVGTTPTVFESEKVRNPYQLSVVRTLRGEGSTIYGYVIVTVMENQLNHNFENLPNNQEFMIMDANNVILSHNNGEKIGQTFPFPYVNQESQQISSDIVEVNNEEYLMTQRSLSFTGWKLVSITPYKMAISKIEAIFNKVFGFQIISFIVFLLLLLYLLGTFTKPLVRLGRVALTVQKGDLETRSNIRGEDEIGRLGFLFDQMLDRIKEMIAEVSYTQARKRKAELAMLQAQINPHFLFNVLNSIRMKVMLRGDRESADMIGSLSKLLRMTINQEKETISLHEEIEIVMDYVVLMNMRQKEPVLLKTDISADALLIKVPRFFLQPLIENALIHGLTQSAGTIMLKAWMEENTLILSVEDNGRGIPVEILHRLRKMLVSGEEREQTAVESPKGFSSIGLLNVHERMRLTYGDRFNMRIDSSEGEGTRITMYIPRVEVTAAYV
ncbi:MULTISPECIES: cache domain-containing sensor histidine kinase [unclassified Paenibacillus]|uniref:cache domain-containing sensor histidine kinase n=1 Tax=unclassified Paenibacillus TaxID=185978 RepID=UPI00362758C0